MNRLTSNEIEVTEQKKKYVTRVTLRKDGWTDTLIKRFLVPAKTVENPHYRCAAPMALYDVEDVERASNTCEFKEAFEKAQRRRGSAKKAVGTKVAKTVDAVMERINRIRPPKELSYTELRHLAIKSYNKFHGHCAAMFDDFEWEPVDENSKLNAEFEKRIMCNYVRHNLMPSYDDICDDSRGRVGKDLYYELYKTAVLDAIYKVYDYLRP